MPYLYSTSPEKWPSQDKPLYRFGLQGDGSVVRTTIRNYQPIENAYGEITSYRFTHKKSIHQVPWHDMDKPLKGYVLSFDPDVSRVYGMFYGQCMAKYEAASKMLKQEQQKMDKLKVHMKNGRYTVVNAPHV